MVHGSFGGQPSEYMKLATALLLARYLATTNRRYLGLGQIAMAEKRFEGSLSRS